MEPDDKPYLELRVARLEVIGDELVRRNGQGSVVTRMPLAEIRSIGQRKQFEPLALMMIGVGLGLAAIAKFVAESNIADIILYAIAVVAAGFGLLGSTSTWIVVESHSGDFRIAGNDAPDEIEGFIASVRRLLHSKTR